MFKETEELDFATAEKIVSGEIKPVEVIKSVSYDQLEILKNIRWLHNHNEAFEVDLTYGKGAFYRKDEKPKHCLDIDPQHDFVVSSCSTDTYFKDASVGSIVFDPPFLTYVRAARTGNGNMIMSNRFSGYWRYDELEDHYKASLREISRIMMKGGILVFKCQDIIHNHRMHCTHANVINWAAECGLKLKDLFVLPAKHRLPSPNRKGTQKHARIFHSYFLVFDK